MSAFSPHPSTPPQPNPPPSLASTLPLGFVHVSFIVVPENPSPLCPSPLAIVRLFLTSMSLVIFCLLFSSVDYVPVKGEIIWYLSLTSWLISLSIMLSSFGVILNSSFSHNPHPVHQKLLSRIWPHLSISFATIPGSCPDYYTSGLTELSTFILASLQSIQITEVRVTLLKQKSNHIMTLLRALQQLPVSLREKARFLT